MSPVDPLRIHRLNDQPESATGRYVLYWMVANRRLRYNSALQRAVHHANRLGQPLVVLEALDGSYPWASQRHHRFVLDGMADKAPQLADAGVTFLPYVEPEVGAGRGLLAALTEAASVVVTDHWPFFHSGRRVAAAARSLPVALEAVDGVGVLPLAASERVYTTAASFRRHLHRALPDHLAARPDATPLDDLACRVPAALPDAVLRGWPAASEALLSGAPGALDALDIDAEVGPVASLPGGAAAAQAALDAFVRGPLPTYHERERDLTRTTSSGLSPYIHFGHISTAEVLVAVLAGEGLTPDTMGELGGSRKGWGRLSEGAMGFLDELITWREAGQVYCARHPEPDAYGALQDWARQTLAEHADDPRPATYPLDAFATAQTHDDLWNACQQQLRAEGTIHNYLRMYWGKKILHWSASPQDAHRILFALNNRFALDGRDPSSTLNLMWTLGLFDRGWGPERPIFGKVRYMNRAGVERKFSTGGYLRRWTSPSA